MRRFSADTNRQTDAPNSPSPQASDSKVGGKLRRAAPWTLLSRLITLGATLVVSALAFRTLEGESFGLWSVCRASVMILAVAGSAGLDRTLWRFAPEIAARAGDGGLRALVARVVRAQFALLLALAGCVALTWRPLLGWLGAPEALAEEAGDSLGWALWALAAATVAFQTFTQVQVSSYRTARVSAATLVRGAIWGIGATILAAAAHLAAVPMWLLLEAGALAAATFFLWPRWSARADSTALAVWLPWRRQANLAAVFTLSALVNFIVQRQSEVYFLARYCDLTTAGLYDLVYSYPQLAIEFVPLATSAIVASAFAEQFTRDPASLKASMQRYFRLLLALSLPLAALGATWADLLLGVVFGGKVESAAHWAQVFSVIHLLPLFFLPLSAALTTAEKAHFVLPLGPIQAAINIGLDLWLIPRYGIAGAVAAVAGTLAIGLPATFWLTRRVLGTTGFPLGFATRVALASLAALAPYPLRWLLPAGWALVVGIPLSVAALVGALVLARAFGPEELSLLRALRNRARPK